MDVRSPSEFSHAHIPGAYPLPLFNDEERKIVGTTYKQKSREHAIKTGLDFFRMRPMLEEAEKLIVKHSLSDGSMNRSVIVHCWRGGMRSGAVAWLLGLYGFKVYVLAGGYKAFRRWVLSQFERNYNFQMLGGYTGSGKTLLLHALINKGHQVVDLENLASHRGSAFGALGQPAQPTQEMFENVVALNLAQFTSDEPVWVEDESQRIGVLTIPHPLWNTMREKPVHFIDVPFESRLENILHEYGSFENNQIIEAILRIQKRLGPKETKDAIGFLLEGNTREAFSILLSYYDKFYNKALFNRINAQEKINKISCSGVDTEANLKKLLSCLQKPA